MVLLDSIGLGVHDTDIPKIEYIQIEVDENEYLVVVVVVDGAIARVSLAGLLCCALIVWFASQPPVSGVCPLLAGSCCVSGRRIHSRGRQFLSSRQFSLSTPGNNTGK